MPHPFIQLTRGDERLPQLLDRLPDHSRFEDVMAYLQQQGYSLSKKGQRTFESYLRRYGSLDEYCENIRQKQADQGVIEEKNQERREYEKRLNHYRSQSIELLDRQLRIGEASIEGYNLILVAIETQLRALTDTELDELFLRSTEGAHLLQQEKQHRQDAEEREEKRRRIEEERFRRGIYFIESLTDALTIVACVQSYEEARRRIVRHIPRAMFDDWLDNSVFGPKAIPGAFQLVFDGCEPDNDEPVAVVRMVERDFFYKLEEWDEPL